MRGFAAYGGAMNQNLGPNTSAMPMGNKQSEQEYLKKQAQQQEQQGRPMWQIVDMMDDSRVQV